MTLVSPGTGTREGLRARLESIPGVERVLTAEPGYGYWLVCPPNSAHAPILRAAHEAIAAEGLEIPVEIVVPAARVERRVRFEGVERIAESNRAVRVRVFLEWNGERHAGDVLGEGGDQVELRTTALAAIAAVENVTGERLGLRLVGVKQIRAFDSDLVVVSLHGSAPGQKLLGAVLSGNDPYRATAIAVLAGLNRMLGNYLMTR
jgi:hypothetical protein